VSRAGTGAAGPVAIVGYAHSPVSRRSDTPLGVLTVETALAAIADAGLSKEQVDGFTTGALFPSSGGGALEDGVHIVTSDWLVERLRVQPRWLAGFQGVGQIPGAMILAANAIASGAADYVLVHRAMYNPPKRYHENPLVAAAGPDQWTAPHGLWGPPAQMALAYNEYMQRYGATREAMAEVVVEARRNGSQIPWSHWYGKPLTVEEYMSSPMVADPISVLDCDIPVSGVGAFVLTGGARARDSRHRPVYVAGYAQGRWRSSNSLDFWTLDDIYEGGAVTAGRLWESSGLKPDDVGLPQVYDGFSPMVYFWLETLGYCPVGEAHRFVAEGGIRTNGGLPALSGGGALGNGRMHGVPQTLECYLQLAGRAGDRQIDGIDVALACQSTPNFGGVVAYSTVPPR
jgi:acetyl-CoA acetyltransferase